MPNQPSGTITTPNRVVLIGRGRYEEAPLSSGKTIYPGHLIMDDGSGNYQPHNVQGGWAELCFALEHGLEGIGGATVPIGAFDAYSAGTTGAASTVFSYFAAKGDKLNVLINSVNATEGSLLMSNGDGNLTLLPSAANLGGNLYDSTAASTAVTNTTTQTVFSNGSYTIPANFLQVGDILHIRAQGIVTAHNASDTLTVQLYIGGTSGTSVCSTGAVNNAANDEFLIDAYIEVRAIGNSSTGVVIANGMVNDGTPGTATTKAFLLGATNVDTTVTEQLAVAATWSAASASDSCRLDLMTVDIIRASGGLKALAIVDTATDNHLGTGTTYSYSPSALCVVRIL